MRHLGSLLLSLVLTAASYLLLGIGLSRWFTAVRTLHAPSVADLAVVLFSLLGAALLYGLMLLLRLSPVGTVLAGVALLALGCWALFTIGHSGGPFEVLPRSTLGFPDDLDLPTYQGYPLVLAVPLLLTVFSPRRWRRYANPQPAAVAAPTNGYPPPGGYPPPAGGYPPPGSPVPPVSPAAGDGGQPAPTRTFPAYPGDSLPQRPSTPSYPASAFTAAPPAQPTPSAQPVQAAPSTAPVGSAATMPDAPTQPLRGGPTGTEPGGGYPLPPGYRPPPNWTAPGQDRGGYPPADPDATRPL